MKSIKSCSDKINRLKQALENSNSIMIGAGAGLSTSAGFIYSGERFDKYFFDFAEKYPFTDMYSGGFYPFPKREEFWAFWSRNIWVNRYMKASMPVYDDLLRLVKKKDYFVLTTNVDHCFQKAGFDKKRLFYTQGDYGLFQCSQPCHNKTYENENVIREMIIAQGWEIGAENELVLREGVQLRMKIPEELMPVCPVCGRPMTMNLRTDEKFVEDEGWHQAAERYQQFLQTHEGKVLFLELGVGDNTPAIIKYPFWKMTLQNPNSIYACVNYDMDNCPREISERSICLNGNIGDVIKAIQ